MNKQKNERGEIVYSFPLSLEHGLELADNLNRMKIEASLARVEKAIEEIKFNPGDPRFPRLPRIEELIRRLPRQLGRKQYQLALGTLQDLHVECIACNRLILEPIAERGRKFQPRGRGTNAMTRLIDQALAKLGRKASAVQVRAEVLKMAPPGMIEHVDPDDGSIDWYEGLKPRSMTFASFQKRVSDRRKKNLERPISRNR